MRDTPRSLRRTTAALALLALTATGCAGTGALDPGAARAAPPEPSAPCLTSALAATVALRPAEADSTVRTALMTLTNTTAERCSLNGWVTVTVVDAARDVVPVPAVKLDEPAQPATFELEAGGSAYTGLRWISCSPTAAGCAVGANLRYSLSLRADGPVAALTGFPAPKRTRLAMTQLRTGVLTPSADQALDW